jgi:putative transposase
MPYRGDVFVPDHYYHIYNRGAGKEPIFFNPGNYEYLLRLIKKYRRQYGVAVIAYCLMPNHYHFLLRQESEHPLSKFINVLFNAYVQAVNRQQGRKGALFEGRFRHVWVEREDYLIHLCRYIHLNPVKANLVSDPGDWPYSNYPEWLGQRGGTLKDETFIRARFPTPEAYQQFVADAQDAAARLVGGRHQRLDDLFGLHGGSRGQLGTKPLPHLNLFRHCVAPFTNIFVKSF